MVDNLPGRISSAQSEERGEHRGTPDEKVEQTRVETDGRRVRSGKEAKEAARM